MKPKADNEVSALAALTELVSKPSARNLSILDTEPLVWLVSTLFTEDFLEKFLPPASSGDSVKMRGYSPEKFYGDTEFFIQCSSEVSLCFKMAQLAVEDGSIPRYEPIVDEWGASWELTSHLKVRSFPFYVWAENHQFPIPPKLIPVIRDLAKQEFFLNESKSSREFAYPPITQEQFFQKSKEPLWPLGAGILYLLGRRSRGEGKETEFVKIDKVAKQILRYALDAFVAGELNLFDRIAEPETIETILSAKVQPSHFVKWAKGLPVSIPMLSLQLPTRHPSVPKHITPEMALMFDAIEKFWGHYNLQNPDPSKAYKKDEVVAWLMSEAKQRNFKLSPSLARAIDTIIRCPEARQGGNTA